MVVTSVITSFGVNIEWTGRDFNRWVVNFTLLELESSEIHSSTSEISSLHRWSELFTRSFFLKERFRNHRGGGALIDIESVKTFGPKFVLNKGWWFLLGGVQGACPCAPQNLNWSKTRDSCKYKFIPLFFFFSPSNIIIIFSTCYTSVPSYFFCEIHFCETYIQNVISMHSGNIVWCLTVDPCGSLYILWQKSKKPSYLFCV